MKRTESRRRQAIAGRCLVLTTGTLALAACVQIDTPDKPIEINLNIKIQQEIVYRLDTEAKKMIEENSGIF